jgi:hypothetical protein
MIVVGRVALMKALTKEILRWAVILAAGGCGVWQLIDGGRAVLRHSGDGFGVAFILIVYLALAAPCLAVAYICLRRQYRELFLVGGVVGSFLVFAALTVLPEQLGAYEFLEHHTMDDGRGIAFLVFPLCLVMLFGPIYGTAWFFRLCHRLAYPLPAEARRPKTQATHSLLWLGVLCLLVPMMIAMFFFAAHIVQSPHAPIASESIDNALRWIIGFSVIGSLLVFLGLVNRQQVKETAEEALPPEAA